MVAGQVNFDLMSDLNKSMFLQTQLKQTHKMEEHTFYENNIFPSRKKDNYFTTTV